MALYSSKVFLCRIEFETHRNQVGFIIQVLNEEMCNIS